MKQDEMTIESSFFRRPQRPWGGILFFSYVILTLVVGVFADAEWILFQSYGEVGVWPGLICFGVLAPIFEEVFFRGVLLHQSLKKNAWFYSVYANALIFMLFHLPLKQETWSSLQQGLVPLSPGTFVLGFVVSFITWKDSSILYAVALHMAANSLGHHWLTAAEALGVKSFFFL